MEPYDTKSVVKLLKEGQITVEVDGAKPAKSLYLVLLKITHGTKISDLMLDK